MKAEDIATEIIANATALRYEVTTLAQHFAQTKFYGDSRNFPLAHYGYLMACMGQFDLMSRCEFGKGEPPGGQTPRIRDFMVRYLDPQKSDEHRVAIQLMRHTLMHTGALRFLYDRNAKVAYTWRIGFNSSFPPGVRHYTLSVEDSTYQNTILAAVNGQVVTVKALNVRLTKLAEDVPRVAQAYTSKMLSDETLRGCCESVYPGICVQSVEV